MWLEETNKSFNDAIIQAVEPIAYIFKSKYTPEKMVTKDQVEMLVKYTYFTLFKNLIWNRLRT